jgi:hypothetical protein
MHIGGKQKYGEWDNERKAGRRNKSKRKGEEQQVNVLGKSYPQLQV